MPVSGQRSDVRSCCGHISFGRGPGRRGVSKLAINREVANGRHLVMFKKAGDQPLAWNFRQSLSMLTNAVREFCLRYESAIPPLQNPPAQVAAALDTPVDRAFAGPIARTALVPQYGESFADAYGPVMAGVQSPVGGSGSVDGIASSMQSMLKSAFS